jgi:ethanolamine ammonia-lyase large subunit
MDWRKVGNAKKIGTRLIYLPLSKISRKKFITQVGLAGTGMVLLNGCNFMSSGKGASTVFQEQVPDSGEDIVSFIKRARGRFDLDLYRQILGCANAYKEGDEILGIAAASDEERALARELVLNTRLRDVNEHLVFKDDIQALIASTTVQNDDLNGWTFQQLKDFVRTESEDEIKTLMPALTSDVIACLVKTMTNDELIAVGQKAFNPLPNSKIGSKGYLSARIQPNSPTDNIDDITWQVFNAWAFGVGDLLLGTNPVSSEVASVAAIERALFDILQTFQLEETMPNCVLSHIDIQAQVEEINPGTTGIWFQSLAGTVNANQTFDLSIEKMKRHVQQRTGRYGLYAETGQGADFTNGHGEGFDMVIHESRKYGFLRALKQDMNRNRAPNDQPWVFVNDVAGFIGPEVFTSKEQLVRCCLEDTVMGKLHGHTIGLDICSTLHMDITLDDLDWCIEQIMPANPAYLMALPTKNDPMLSYLTTAFNNHVKIREQFGYKVNDAMWDFFKQLEIIDADGQPTDHFGDPVWVYYQYRLAKADRRSKAEIYAEGKQKMEEIRGRGVAIAEGYGAHYWDLNPELDNQVHRLYEDAKVSLWTEMKAEFIAGIPGSVPIITQSKNREDYVYHPESGEKLSRSSVRTLEDMRHKWGMNIPDVQLIISDGLNARALMDEGHLLPFLGKLRQSLDQQGYHVNDQQVVITHGRVRAGYACGEILFGQAKDKVTSKRIIHIIGERPGSGHHNFSTYITSAKPALWAVKGKVDHDITRVVSGISDTALTPQHAVDEIMDILGRMEPIT